MLSRTTPPRGASSISLKISQQMKGEGGSGAGKVIATVFRVVFEETTNGLEEF